MYSNKKKINSFIDLTREFGNNIFYVQAGGGNSSIKVDNSLYIKASGTVFRDANKNNLSVLDECGSQVYKKGFSNLKPSMEFSFHLALKSKYVFHLHCLRSTLISIVDKEPALVDIMHKKGINVTPIKYINPGHDLGEHIRNLNILDFEGILLLKNHGVIIFANSLERIKNITSLLELSTKNILAEENINFSASDLLEEITSRNGFRIFNMNKAIDILDLIKYQDDIFTPDQVIFLTGKINWKPIKSVKEIALDSNYDVYFTLDGRLILKKKNTGLYEMVWALLYLIYGLCLMKKVESYNTISLDNSLKLLDMPEERYRKLLSQQQEK